MSERVEKGITYLNFTRVSKGSILARVEMVYYGLYIDDILVRDGNSGLWVAYPRTEKKKGTNVYKDNPRFECKQDENYFKKHVLDGYVKWDEAEKCDESYIYKK